MVCKTPRLFVLYCTGVLLTPLSSFGQILNPSAVTAEIRIPQNQIFAGEPVWVDFLLFNPTDQATVLFLRKSTAIDLNPVEMGLPLAHIFDSAAEPPFDIRGGDTKVALSPPAITDQQRSVAIRLSPEGIVGARIDMARYCPALREPGTYTLQWLPYGGALQSNVLTLRIVARRQIRLETDFGPIVIELFYDQAPRHVSNILELTEAGFYDHLTFHRIVPDYLIQGGAPDENPSGIRSDGKLLPPEFNEVPFERGVVGMARRPGDPESASCQFFICLRRWPDLDGQYTAFGRLIGDDSYQTLDRIVRQPVDASSKPVAPVYIRSFRSEDAPLLTSPHPSSSTQPLPDHPQ